jgi:hypothetical protein
VRVEAAERFVEAGRRTVTVRKAVAPLLLAALWPRPAPAGAVKEIELRGLDAGAGGGKPVVLELVVPENQRRMEGVFFDYIDFFDD